MNLRQTFNSQARKMRALLFPPMPALACATTLCCLWLMVISTTTALAQQAPPTSSVSGSIITTQYPDGVIIEENLVTGMVKITLPDGSYILRQSKQPAPWIFFDCSNNTRGQLPSNPVIGSGGSVVFQDPKTGKTINLNPAQVDMSQLPCFQPPSPPTTPGGKSGGGGGGSSGSKGNSSPQALTGRPITTSQNDHQSDFYPMGPHQKREDDTTIWGKQPPSGKTWDIQSIQQGAMTATTHFSLPMGPAAELAQTPQHQFVPHAPALQTGSFFRVQDPPWDADLSKHFWSKAPFQDNSPTIGKIISSTADEADLIAMSNQLIDIGTSPSAWNQAAKGMMWDSAQNASDAAASSAQQSFESNIAILHEALPNVANEQSGTPGATGGTLKPLTQALWMVQEMFKRVYLPMALLFLLPGAIVTQVKAYVNYTMNGNSQDEDIASPFVGILRSVIALFLIPATQLIVSYSIDIGNSMTYEVQNLMDESQAVDWSKQQTIAHNAVKPDLHLPNSEFAQRTTMSTLEHLALNTIDMFLNYGLMVLIAFQLVLACYLFLLGPIAASLFAWPSGIGTLFKPVFKSWLDGLTLLVLWRFWWCVILLCMCVRIAWLKDLGQYVPDSQWEAITYTAFMVMLTYVPFLPFDFKPGDMVDNLLSKTGGLASSSPARPAGANALPRSTMHA